MTTRDQQRLAGVHPGLAQTIGRVIDAMALLGFPMGVTDGVRSSQQQIELYRHGREWVAGAWKVVGPTVTNCDGVEKKSNHQRHADGYGHAVDCAFLVDLDGKGELDFTWSDTRPWTLYGAIVESQGLTWGGRWSSPHDLPHAETRPS